MHSRIVDLVLFYPLFLFSLSFHEAAHGWVAEKFGDDTARIMGRISLSPLAHIDIVGTVILPIVGILTGAPVIGWGKPVPVSVGRLKGDQRRSVLWVSISGPFSNFLLALAFAALTHGLVAAVPAMPPALLVPGSVGATAIGAIFAICQMGVILNLMLGFFNLLPLPPLDGGGVLRGILPASMLDSFDRFSRYSFLILLVLFVTGLLKFLFAPVMLIAGYLLPM